MARVQITRHMKKETSVASYSRPFQAALGQVCKPGGILEGGSVQGEAILSTFGSCCKSKAL